MRKFINTKIKNATVQIFVGDEFQGTGFFITNDGLILTAYHCIGPFPPDIKIKTRFNDEFDAQLDESKSLEHYDIAVLKVNHNTTDCLPLTIVSKQKVAGDDIVAMGYPAADIKGNDDIKEYHCKISGFNNSKIELPDAVKGKGQSGGPVYHYDSNCVIGIVSRQFFPEQMTDTGLAVRLDMLFEKWPELNFLIKEVKLSWDKSFETIGKHSEPEPSKSSSSQPIEQFNSEIDQEQIEPSVSKPIDKPISDIDQKQRIELFKAWQELKAIQRVPTGLEVEAEEDQKVLQDKLPIDFTHINNLFSFLGIPYKSSPYQFEVPMEPDRYYYLRDHFKEISDQLFRKTQEILKTNQRHDLYKIFNSIYSDLSKYIPYEYIDYDVAIVPGARTTLRAKKARELYHSRIVKKIFVTGNYPAYAENTKDVRFLSEAEAMWIYLVDSKLIEGVDAKAIPSEDIKIDKKATNTCENANFSIHVLKEFKSELHRKINLLLVTSPYHIKRFALFFQALKQDSRIQLTIDKIGAYPTETKYTKESWYTTENGFKTYLSEYWKILGGRLLAEF